MKGTQGKLKVTSAFQTENILKGAHLFSDKHKSSHLNQGGLSWNSYTAALYPSASRIACHLFLFQKFIKQLRINFLN